MSFVTGNSGIFWPMNFSMASRWSAVFSLARVMARPVAPARAGPADAVDVVLAVLGHVVVDDHLQVVDVQPARGHVRGDEHGEACRP